MGHHQIAGILILIIIVTCIVKYIFPLAASESESVSVKGKADWMAWFLQLIFGSFVGFLIGFALSYQRRRGCWLEAGSVIPFIVGMGLLTGAFASHFGDKLWMGDDYRMISLQEPPQSKVSSSCSLVIGVVGFFLVGYALLVNFGLL
jgi:hypothetical protein